MVILMLLSGMVVDIVDFLLVVVMTVLMLLVCWYCFLLVVLLQGLEFCRSTRHSSRRKTCGSLWTTAHFCRSIIF